SSRTIMTKYIFDFDDVLFFNTEKFKKHMYKCFDDVGIPYEVVKRYYKIDRDKGFVLANLVRSVVDGERLQSVTAPELIEQIMGACKTFVNQTLLDRIKQLPVENCYMVTHGVHEYQLEKINRTGIKHLFAGISIIQDTKKGSVEAICEKFKDDTVVFIDDKEKRFADLDFKKYPKLKTVLYVGPESIDKIFKYEKDGRD
ncbi:MAG: hypothetical protein V1895_02955, partial [Parcubacteria group bacterium]